MNFLNLDFLQNEDLAFLYFKCPLLEKRKTRNTIQGIHSNVDLMHMARLTSTRHARVEMDRISFRLLVG